MDEVNVENMRVSFDLDEVLFVSPKTHKTEKELMFPFNKIYKERIRLGAPRLISKLQEMGIEVWVYTSSYRSERYIKGLFRHYGIRFDSIVNAQRHNREVQGDKPNLLPNKIPSRYRISLHIDDEAIVVTQGRNYGFEVFQLEAQDDDWEEKIIDRIYAIRRREIAQSEK